MNITIISIFRNATGHIERYCAQMDALQGALAQRGDTLTLLLGYGDSSDDTAALLYEACLARFDALLVDVSHGGPHFGSVENAQRFKQLAGVGNKLLGYVPPTADVVGIVESDLLWEAQTIVRLVDDLADVPCVAPMVMDGPDSFYDVFAFRRNGVRFSKQPPYHADLADEADLNLLEVDSAGSVLLLDASLARQVRFGEAQAIVDFCAGVRACGGSVWLDTNVAACHV